MNYNIKKTLRFIPLGFSFILCTVGSDIYAQTYVAKCARVVHGNGIPVLSSENKVANLAYGTSYGDCCKNDVAAVVAPEPVKMKLDTDADGVYDDTDKCANTPSGVSTDAMGCPLDGDADGIADYLDACPAIAGVELHKGCKDTDMDGIADPNDRCPEVAGTAELKGCKDTDLDGLVDIDDKCPAVAGILENKGCPKIEEKTMKILNTALTGLKFETGKATIVKSSYKVLDKVVEVMKTHNEYKLDIAGHTDNSGDAAKNLALSKDRAEAAKNYLISKGIAESNLTANGFGSEMPIGDNKTAAGKAKNRRVEFKIGF